MSSCSCLLLPAKRVWRSLRARLGLRRATTTGNDNGNGCAGGLGQLWKEVRACEYSDVHVMWDMLGGTGTGVVGDGRPTAAGAMGPGRVGRKLAAWSRLASYCCALDLNSD